MTILDRKGAKKLCKSYEYNPTHIGCAILRICGYEVEESLYGDVVVKDSKTDRIVYWDDSRGGWDL